MVLGEYCMRALFSPFLPFLIEANGHQVAAMTSEAKQQRNALDKRVSKIAGYGISV